MTPFPVAEPEFVRHRDEVGRALQWGGTPRTASNCEMHTLLVNVLSCLDFLELALETQCMGSPSLCTVLGLRRDSLACERKLGLKV